MRLGCVYGCAATSLRRRRIHLSLPLLFLFAAAVSGADADAPAEPALAGEIVVGVTLPLTGKFDTYGQSAYYGVLTRINMINGEGGVNGKKLVVQWRDNGSDPEQAVRDVEELAEKYRMPAVIGPLLDDSAMAVLPVAERLGVVIVSPMAAMDAMGRENPWVFRSNFSNSAQGTALARFQIDKYGAASCGILYDSSYGYCGELAEIFEREFTERGGRVVGVASLRRAGGEKDYLTPLRELTAKNPDFLFVPCYAPEATEVVHAVKTLGVGVRLCGPNTWDSELVFDASGSRLAGTAFASSLFEQEFGYRPFRRFFEAMEQAGMDNPDAQAASAYDAVSLLAQALKNGETPEAVREGLLAIRRMPLATGRTDITANGAAAKPVLIRIAERRNGRMVPVYAERYDP